MDSGGSVATGSVEADELGGILYRVTSNKCDLISACSSAIGIPLRRRQSQLQQFVFPLHRWPGTRPTPVAHFPGRNDDDIEVCEGEQVNVWDEITELYGRLKSLGQERYDLVS